MAHWSSDPTLREKVRRVISRKAKERAIQDNPISRIVQSTTADQNRVLVRQAKGTYKRPHKRNRKLLDISDVTFKRAVKRYGVLGASRLWNISQSAIRDRAWQMGFRLKPGPRPAMTTTSEYRRQMREQRMSQKFPFRGTSIEIALWDELNRRGIKFEKHKSVLGITQPDAFISPDVCIYADGDYWHNRQDVKEKDQRINQALLKKGYKIIRLWEHDLKRNVKACVDRIEDIL